MKDCHAPLALVVDDDKDTSAILQKLMIFAGFKVETTNDGRRAIDRAIKLRPAVILLDIDIPEADGLEVARRLRAHRGTRNIPIIAVTGHGLPEEKNSAFLAGVNAFLTKPIQLEELLTEVQRITGPEAARPESSKP